MSNCGKMPNTILTPDKVLNVLMYETIHFDEVQYVGEQTRNVLEMKRHFSVVWFYQTSAKNI